MKEMEGDHFCLRRRNFESHFMNGLRILYMERGVGDVDVTLSAEEKYVQCHKWLLCLCSPYFKKLFRTNSIASKAGNTVVILPNVKFRDLENLVHFMYNGEVKVKTNEEVQGVLEAGELLKVEGLSKSVERPKGSKQSEATSQTQKTNLTISSSSVPSGDKVPSTPATRGSFTSQRTRNKRPGSDSVPYAAPTETHEDSQGPSGSKRLRQDGHKPLGKPVGRVKKFYGSAVASQGIQDNHETERYNEDSGELDPLAQVEVHEEEDPLGNIGIDPLAFDEDGSEESTEPIVIKLEDVDYQNIEAYAKEELNATDHQEDNVGSATTGLDSPRSDLSTISKLVLAERDSSDYSGAPWFFTKYYGGHMESLIDSYEKKECAVCGLEISCKTRLARHVITHLTPNFPCRICGNILSSDVAMCCHLKAKHGIIGTGRNWE